MSLRNFILFIFITIVFFPGIILSEQFSIRKVGEWGSGLYRDVYVQGDYAYCAAEEAGLDIIDINNPAAPRKIGEVPTLQAAEVVIGINNCVYIKTRNRSGLEIVDVTHPSQPILKGNTMISGDAERFAFKGDVVYAADNYWLRIINVENPFSPTLLGEYKIDGTFFDVFVVGDYAYAAASIKVNGQKRHALLIIDISNPGKPRQVSQYYSSSSTEPEVVYVQGKYAYLGFYGHLKVINVSNPKNPVEVVDITGFHTFMKDIYVNGNYGYVIDGARELKIMDFSNLASPTQVGSYQTIADTCALDFSKGYVYMAAGYGGLHIVDISDPLTPKQKGCYDVSGHALNLDVSGNYIYLAHHYGGLQVIDISEPDSPELVGVYDNSDYVYNVKVSGKIAYVIDMWNGLEIVDVSNPASPVLRGTIDISGGTNDVSVVNNYAYVGYCFAGLQIVDVSNPVSPNSMSIYGTGGCVGGIDVQGNYAYLAVFTERLEIVDISIPTSPKLISKYLSPGDAMDIHVQGNYAYLADGDKGLRIIDISNSAFPTNVGSYYMSWCGNVYVVDNYAYAVCGPEGLKVIDVSDPYKPKLVASYDTPQNAMGIKVQGDYIYVADGLNGKFFILQLYNPSKYPRINLDRNKLTFASTSVYPGAKTETQSFIINNNGGGTLNWSVAADRNWLNCSPASGINNGEVSVSVDTTGLSAGTYLGAVTISDPQAVNSPQTVAVALKVYESTQTTVPFGVFATPIDGSIVSGSIPVTGWVLDDIGLQDLQVFREEGNSLVYIGDAVFVEGARPDVEQAYPWFPMNYKAGWGYMLLTNFLPDGGNGIFKIHAVATDLEGNQATLGVKTIICDNDNATKPFGTIDTPMQGGIASGNQFVNFGWALTPSPNTIPPDGSTIQVWVDGVSIGNPVYNRYREDIAALFPGYSNSIGAGGYFYLDTSHYENGVHTISWSVTDDAGNTDGIGSRYFTIQNQIPGNLQQALSNREENLELSEIEKISVNYSLPLLVNKGYNPDAEPEMFYADENGDVIINIKELERVEIYFSGDFSSEISGSQFTGFQVVGNQFRALPIGSRLNPQTGIFSWTPGPGHYGSYTLLFIKRSAMAGQSNKYHIQINIMPHWIK